MTLRIQGEVDDHGWVFPFGHFKKIRKFLEYYFDHTAVISADDPRLAEVIKFNEEQQVFNLRVLPFGVSMEMSNLFVWMWVNAYVYDVTAGRCVVTHIESREHEKNAAELEFTEAEAMRMGYDFKMKVGDMTLPEAPVWAFVPPKEVLAEIAAITKED